MADSDDLNPIYVDDPDAPKSEETPAGRTQEKLDKFKEIAGENLERVKVVTIKSLIVAKDVSLKLITKAKENWEPLKELVKRFTHFDSDIFRTTQRFCIRNPAIFVVFGIFMFFCIYRFLVFVDPVEEDILDEVTLVEEFHPFNFNKYTVPSNLTQKKVVLFSYTRAGASILGHIFNLAPSVAYWYEPMHSFYTHLFGNRVFAISNEITHRENGMRREMSEEEQTKAASFIKDLLSCKFENIPVETFSIESIVERKIEWMQSYRECMLGRVDNPTVRHCMDPLSSFCGSMTTHCIKERCDYFNELARQAQTSDQRDRAIEEVEAKSKKKLKAFMDKEDCMADLVQAQSYCLPDLHAACLDARINVMKVYRTSPVVLEEVLSTDPDVFVIHYFRDPRAMIWSRQQSDTLSTISGKKDKSESAARHMEREARMLCRQLVEDILAISKIKMKYADRIAVFRYEDFVANANETIAYVYGRIGEEYPSTLPNRINRLMTSNREPDGPFGYIRQDAAQTAHAWREAIDPEVKVFIDNECKGVLTALKYEV